MHLLVNPLRTHRLRNYDAVMETKPRILIIWHGALYPSYRAPFWRLHTHHGWDVHLLCAARWSQALPQTVAFVPHPDEPIAVYPRKAWMRFHGATFVQPGLPWIMRHVQPDLVYIIEEPFSLMGWMAAYWCQRHCPPIPYVMYTYQDLYKTYPAPFASMQRFCLRHARRMLVPNTQGGRVLEQKGYTRTWDVVPASVHLERFPFREPVHDSLFTLGYIGRLVPEKGLDTLLWALSESDDRVRLRITGDGPMKGKLQTLTHELGIEHQVAFLRPVSHEDMAQALHDLDALVLPSITTEAWQEQFGRVLIEAMACGVPVIGSDSGAIPEVIGDAGLVFPEGDGNALTERILLLAQDAPLRTHLAHAGRKRVEERYSIDRVAETIHHHIQSVLNDACRD